MLIQDVLRHLDSLPLSTTADAKAFAIEARRLIDLIESLPSLAPTKVPTAPAPSATAPAAAG